MTKAFHRRARTSGPRQQLLGLSSRIARRLLAWSLVVGGVGSIILSTWDLMSELEHRVEETHQSFDAATISVVPALVQSIWTFDAEQIRLHTEGLARFPYVDEVQTRLADATTLRAGFTSAGDEVIERTVALTYQDAGHLHDLGTLILIHDLAADRQLLYRQWGLTFIRNAAFILLIALTVTFVYQTVVTRRLIDITSGMRNVGADDLRQREPALGSPRPDTARDELDELAESIELLWRTGGEALRMADLSEQELIRHRDHLEELVDEQVHDLDSARRDAERARQMLQKVLDTIPVRVFWKDTDSRFLGCNRLFALDAGFEHSHDLVGRSDHDMGWRSEAESYRADDAAVMRENQPRFDYEEFQTSPDGRKVWVRTSKIPLHDEDGQVIGVLGTYEDITARKQADMQLRQARDDAQQANRAKSEFLANMSHEIRTPLNAVLGMAGIGLHECREPEVREHFRHILQSGRHLLGIINDILDFSRIEAGKLVTESRPFQLLAAVEAAVGMVSERADATRLSLQMEFEGELPEWVAGDSLRLQQILVNLLGNAIKFTPEGSVRLSVHADSDLISFDVSDTGIGISADKLARLFTPFEQADSSTTRKFGGSGLGLAISDNLARLMGGRISVRSTPGEGSVFTLRLPLPEAPAETGVDEAPLEPTGPRLEGRRILAAEDVEVNRLVLEYMLEMEGATVVFAENGLQAVQAVEQAGPGGLDAVLMDVHMPVMDGLEATRRILRIDPALPVLALTAHALAEERVRCLQAGMVEHVCKPVEPRALIEGLLRHMGPHGQRPPIRCPMGAHPP